MWHDIPFCPFGRPEPPRVVTPGAIQTRRELSELERTGVLAPRMQFRLRWVLLPMLALGVYLLLTILL